MGTRGFITFAVNGKNKTAYNQFDSYPSGVGLTVLNWLRTVDPAQMREQAAALRVVDSQSKPTRSDIKRLAAYTDLGVSNQSTDDWYCLLRQTQGNPAKMLEAGVIEDASGFPADSLFAEYGYVIDLDGDGLFEVYEGFQKSPHSKGRFASMDHDDDYYPVALKARWPLAELPSDVDFLIATEPTEN